MAELTPEDWVTQTHLKWIRHRENHFQRLGQWYSNSLSKDRPELADRMRTQNCDPFYLDDLIPEFLSFILENWEAK